jgi:hypothetical protein
MQANLEKSKNQGRSRYRSPNGKNRPYLDGDRWKLVAREILPNGEEVKVVGSGRTQRDCISNTEKLLAKRRSKAIEIRPDKSFVSRCKNWIEAKRSLSQLRYKTIQGYSGVLRLYIGPYFRDLSLNDISRL